MPDKRFAAIGVGLWGESHALVYARHPHAFLAAVCDLNEQRAQEVAVRYKAEWCTSDYRQVLADPTIDAVSVATPDFAHAEIVIAAARAGKHVLVEKPLATTVAEAEAMVQAAQEAGVSLMVDFHNRWSPIFNHARDALRAGELGRPLIFDLHMSNTKFVATKMLSWASRSSVLWFLGPHAVDQMCWILGEYPRRVHALVRSGVLEGMGVKTPDLYAITFEFPSGAIGRLEHVWVLPDSQPNICDFRGHIVGSEGALYLEPLTHHDATKYTDKPHLVDTVGAPMIQGERHGFMLASIEHFVDCVTNNKPPLVTGAEGLAVTRILCAVEESVARGDWVEIVY